MPKKRDGPDTKKTRKSSSASKDAVSNSPLGGSDILPPPTPSASHLVASNPFDDTVPPNPMKMMHNFSNQPMIRMGGGMGPNFPTWGPGPRSGMRPQFGAPGTPNWNPNIHGNANMGPGPLPGYNPSMGNNGYSHFPGGGPFRGPSRMPMNIRPGMGPMGSPEGDGMMHDPSSMGPNHMVSSGNQGHMLQNTGQMKALTRPTSQMASPRIRKGSASSNKIANDSKSPKAESALAKQRKKAEKKLSQDNKSKNNDNDRLSSSNGCDSNIPPHSIPPKEPQTCSLCSKNIEYPLEDAIRCLASCNKWYHRTCVGLTEAAFKCLKSEELAIWACDMCLQMKEIQSVRSRVPIRDGQLASA